jgi:two-component system sensor histidine kinase FlrB
VLEGQVRDMLLFVRGSKSHVETVFVSELIESMHVAFDGMMEQSNALIYCSQSSQTGHFKGNVEALVGAIQNILNNSIQACNECGIKPKITVDTDVNAKGELKIKVKDNGPGMSKEILQKIKSPFFTTKSTGTGLGIAVVRTVVEQHKGELTIDSQEGKGTCVTISIPAVKVLN